MTRRLLATIARAMAWNVLLGAAIGVATFLVLVVVLAADLREDDLTVVFLVIGLPYALVIGAAQGAVAGVVHGLSQIPLVARPQRRARLVARVSATVVSAALVVAMAVGYATPRALTTWSALPFLAYVALTPFVATWGYEDASTDAALSAARRSGASSGSRTSDGDSDSSRATSA